MKHLVLIAFALSFATNAAAERYAPTKLVRAVEKLVPIAKGRVKRAPQAHLLTQELAEHMRPETRQNYYGLVHYRGPSAEGSGAIVGLWTGKKGKLRALVLTNNHVVDGNTGHGTTISFMDGTQSRRSHVVASNPLLDYALVEVELKATPSLSPVKTSFDLLPAGSPIYSMGAATSMTTYKIDDFVDASRSTRKQLKKAVAEGLVFEHPTISLGRITSNDVEVSRTTDGVRRLLQSTDLALAPGASGGPVFSAQTHELVALNESTARDSHNAYGGTTSLAYIMHDLGKQMRRGRIAVRSQDTVGTLLQEYENRATAAQGEPSAANDSAQ